MSVLLNRLNFFHGVWPRCSEVSKQAAAGQVGSTNNEASLGDSIEALRVITDQPEVTQVKKTWTASAREHLQSIFKFFTRIFCGFSAKKSEGTEGFYAGQNYTNEQVELPVSGESKIASAGRDSLDASHHDWNKALGLGLDKETGATDRENQSTFYRQVSSTGPYLKLTRMKQE